MKETNPTVYRRKCFLINAAYVAVIAAIVLLVNLIIGNTGWGVGLALLYLVVTVVRNVLEPKIVGSQVGLHPLVTLMSMVVGSSLMGGVGLFGLPITLAVINKMNKDGVIRLYNTRRDETDRAA